MVRNMIDDLLAIEDFRRYLGVDPNEYTGFDHMIYGRYGSFLRDLILSKENPALVEDSFDRFNSFCENTTSEVDEVLKVSFFEPLMDASEVIAVARKKFTGKALAMFEDVRNGPMFGGVE